MRPGAFAAFAAALGLAAAGCGGSGGDRPAATVTAARTTTQIVTQPTPTPPPQVASDHFAAVVARVLPSVANVRATTFSGDEAEGSGVVVDRKGVLVTNYHVVRDARSLKVAFNDGRHRKPLTASVVGTAPERDIAVIRVQVQDLLPLALGSSSGLRLGDDLLAIGFPLGLGGPTVTRGIVSGLNRTITPGDGPTLEGLLQTDAAINPGNSGGALVNAAGELVGINTAAASAGAAENVGFAIAIDEARPVIEEIRSKPPDRRAWLGVAVDSVDTPEDAAQLGLDPGVRGAVVVSVVPTGPAAKAGLHEGDVIVRVHDQKIRSASDLTRALGRYDPGDPVTMDVVDPLGPRRVTLKLARRPATIG